MRAREIAVAFFKAEHEAFRVALPLEKTDLLADELEARERAAQFHAVFPRHGVGHIGRDDGRDGDGVFRHGAVLQPPPAEIVEQEHADLVAREQPVSARFVWDGYAAAVAVRVRADQKIGMHAPAAGKAERHSLGDLGVGIRAGREMTVRVLLRLDERQPSDAKSSEQLFHALQAGAVERRIDDAEVRKRAAAHAQGKNRIDKRVQNGVRDPADPACGEKRSKAFRLAPVKVRA